MGLDFVTVSMAYVER